MLDSQALTVALLAGLVVCVLGLITTWSSLAVGRPRRDWPSAGTMARIGVGLFLAGSLGHLFFEVTGLHARYC